MLHRTHRLSEWPDPSAPPRAAPSRGSGPILKPERPSCGAAFGQRVTAKQAPHPRPHMRSPSPSAVERGAPPVTRQRLPKEFRSLAAAPKMNELVAKRTLTTMAPTWSTRRSQQHRGDQPQGRPGQGHGDVVGQDVRLPGGQARRLGVHPGGVQRKGRVQEDLSGKEASARVRPRAGRRRQAAGDSVSSHVAQTWGQCTREGPQTASFRHGRTGGPQDPAPSGRGSVSPAATF